MKNYAWYQLMKKAYNHRILMEMLKCVGEGVNENRFFRKELFSKKAEAILFNSYLKDNQYKIITIFDEYYPFLLKKIYDPPIAFFKGNAQLLKNQ
ncbi:hypothetical protein AZF37_03715 [endosymbiont 'TC1' of Trimyema compressum]|uniref:hypothetical protein n=1 Tax=endosymbiont 'TC1' of Trimyema compressum TaxID=243899 RepID=UPI0007F08B19|nr:hypothetical protein [endosymbiont 'TC1' of Trimyema compressum]AMP20394.1 hypothetical protein AZF37_03715 [endosymbiont 'TC1' of Trimyema compressum]